MSTGWSGVISVCFEWLKLINFTRPTQQESGICWSNICFLEKKFIQIVCQYCHDGWGNKLKGWRPLQWGWLRGSGHGAQEIKNALHCAQAIKLSLSKVPEINFCSAWWTRNKETLYTVHVEPPFPPAYIWFKVKFDITIIIP